jgi:segregation and condensation protein B
MVEVAHDITEEPVETVEDDAIDEVGTEQSTSEDAVSEDASSEETASEETTPYDVEHALRDMVQEARIVEALLFAATEPVSTDFLAERLPEGTDIGAILEDIRNLYADRGVNLARVAGKWSLRTAEDLSPHLRIERKVSRKPSRAAVESLAIIAYHQPVTRSEVEEIRGVSVSKGSFDVLLEAGWIKPVGRRRTPGRPTTWGTTPNFLEEFGLDSLGDLPGVEELKASGLLDTRPAGTIIGDTGEMYHDAEAEGAPEDDKPEALDDGDDAGPALSDETGSETEDSPEEMGAEAFAEMESEAEQDPEGELEQDEMPDREAQTG